MNTEPRPPTRIEVGAGDANDSIDSFRVLHRAQRGEFPLTVIAADSAIGALLVARAQGLDACIAYPSSRSSDLDGPMLQRFRSGQLIRGVCPCCDYPLDVDSPAGVDAVQCPECGIAMAGNYARERSRPSAATTARERAGIYRNLSFVFIAASLAYPPLAGYAIIIAVLALVLSRGRLGWIGLAAAVAAAALHRVLR